MESKMKSNDKFKYELKEDGLIYVTKDNKLFARVTFTYLHGEEYKEVDDPDMLWEKPYSDIWTVVYSQAELEKDLENL